MNIRHNHVWKEQERFYQKAPDRIEAASISPEALEKLLGDKTTIVLFCPECGELKTLVIAGRSQTSGS